jgi:hypothetical protein
LNFRVRRKAVLTLRASAAWEHAFVTAEGHPLARFQRAIKVGNVMLADLTAREMTRLSLRDALSLVALYAEKTPERFERAAVRWHARLEREARGLTLADAQLALAALQALRSPAKGEARTLLAELVERLRVR